MTYKEIINAVLRRLREDSIQTNVWTAGNLLDNTRVTQYQQMVGDLVNEAKKEVEDAWNWVTLRNSETITTSSGTQSYTIPDTNERTRILLAQEHSNGTILQEMADKYIQFTKYPTSSVQNALPSYYSVTGIDSSTGRLTVEFDPVPDAQYQISFRVVTPQEDLTVPTDVVKVPHQPVILGALALAIAERGEDGGSMSDLVAQQYINSLSDAIQIDAGHTVGETDFCAC